MAQALVACIDEDAEFFASVPTTTAACDGDAAKPFCSAIRESRFCSVSSAEDDAWDCECHWPPAQSESTIHEVLADDCAGAIAACLEADIELPTAVS